MNEPTEEEIVFRTDKDLAEALASALCSSIISELSEGTSSLPMLDKPDLLLEMIQKPYLKNLDIFEMYCRRSIFSLDMYSPKERRAIVQMIDGRADGPAVDDEMEDDDNRLGTAVEAMGIMDDMSSPSEPPSDDVLQSLKEETESLCHQLRLLENESTALHCEVQEWNATADLISGSLLDGAQLHQSVSATAIGREGLEGFCQKNMELLEELEADGAHGTLNNSGGFLPTKRQMKLEERFGKERQLLFESSIGELNVLKRLLAKGKENSE